MTYKRLATPWLPLHLRRLSPACSWEACGRGWAVAWWRICRAGHSLSGAAERPRRKHALCKGWAVVLDMAAHMFSVSGMPGCHKTLLSLHACHEPWSAMTHPVACSYVFCGAVLMLKCYAPVVTPNGLPQRQCIRRRSAMFWLADEEDRPAARAPALNAATTKALSAVFRHLASPRHLGLVVYLPMLAQSTSLQGAPSHHIAAGCSLPHTTLKTWHACPTDWPTVGDVSAWMQRNSRRPLSACRLPCRPPVEGYDPSAVAAGHCAAPGRRLAQQLSTRKPVQHACRGPSV